MSNWTPADWVELIKALGLLCIPVATAYTIIGAARAKRAETASLANAQIIGKVQDNVALIERNTNSLSTRMADLARKDGVHEGTALGRQEGVDQAAKLLVGQRQGAESERASVAAANPSRAAAAPNDIVAAAPQPSGAPLPVADDRTAVAAEKGAAATERIADEAEKSGLSKKV